MKAQFSINSMLKNAIKKKILELTFQTRDSDYEIGIIS
jgi:hypothetical protein